MREYQCTGLKTTDVALDDGSENLVLLTNVMFQNLYYGIKELPEVVEVIRSKHTLWIEWSERKKLSIYEHITGYVSKN